LTAATSFAKVRGMAKAPSDLAKRARDLLEKKAARDLPDGKRVKSAAAARAESSADTFFSALVEGAFLLAAADGELSEQEENTLAETIGYVTGEVLEPDEFMGMIDGFAAALSDDGFSGRVEALKGVLPDEAARREVLAFAALVALCDRNLADSERAALGQLGEAFGIAKEAVAETVAAIEKELGLSISCRKHGAPAPRPQPSSRSAALRKARASPSSPATAAAAPSSCPSPDAAPGGAPAATAAPGLGGRR
jgi:tellurite resistance protein